MNAQQAAVTAIAGYSVFLLLAFGLRSVAHYRRTGTTGFVGISGPPGSVEWWGGALFTIAVIAGGAAPVLQVTGTVVPLLSIMTPWTQGIAIAMYAIGTAGTLWAQFAMGDSWRIGVDEKTQTELVFSGPFRWIRNPIFTAMGTATLGLVLLVPNIVAAMALITLVAALHIQVRLVEEPYLTRVHGKRYRDYMAGTGRFLPRLH